MSDVLNDSVPDLSSCATEPIHLIGRIQSFGYLVAFSSDWIINHVSANCEALFGVPPADLVGTPATVHIAADAIHDIRSRLQMLGDADTVERIFQLDLLGSGQLFDITIHTSGRSFVLEAEPAATGRRHDYVSYVRPLADRMRDLGSVVELCQVAARQLRGLTGFDRVMVYRFERDGAGEVIAESKGGSVDGFLGLHFPSSDIPAQARKLYTRNLLRIISDIDDPTVPIVPATNPSGQPLDLSMSGLRAVSPIHIEYLRNMGVKASMSVSIMRNGELWGLMACHHYTPLRLETGVRAACELFGQFMSFLLEQTELRQINRQKNLAIRLHDEIMGRVAPGAHMIDAFDGFCESIRKVIPCDSIAGWIGGQLVGIGSVPSPEQFEQLARFLNTTGASRVWHTDNLSGVYPPAADQFGDEWAGLMSLPVSRSPRDYIVLFRKAHSQCVNWAGNPEKPVEYGPNGARLTPRKSFEIWKEEREGHAIPWTDEEVATADSLRITLLEVVLRMNDAVQHERDKASRRQETLIAELNHRVRNILNLIRSLISQSFDEAHSPREFAHVIEHRIHALARAHDQVTRLNWGPASVQALILAECEAYLDDKRDRVSISGFDVMVEPAAFSALALVFHELMTNSSKYGSLSDGKGKVAVAIERGTGGDIEITWSECGGPKVSKPTRRGFGSAIIEYSIPHELGGRSKVLYEPGGLVVSFSIPRHHVSACAPLDERGGEPVTENPEDPETALLSGDVLIAEDNLIVAMEAEDRLRSLGATRCHVAGNVTAALNIARRFDLAFALLDVNLGTETSEPIARHLALHKVPYVVASGYGSDARDSGVNEGDVSITKPYSQADLAKAIATSMRRRQA